VIALARVAGSYSALFSGSIAVRAHLAGDAGLLRQRVRKVDGDRRLSFERQRQPAQGYRYDGEQVLARCIQYLARFAVFVTQFVAGAGEGLLRSIMHESPLALSKVLGARHDL